MSNDSSSNSSESSSESSSDSSDENSPAINRRKRRQPYKHSTSEPQSKLSKYSCPNCGKGYTSKTWYQKHVKDCKRESSSESESESESEAESKTTDSDVLPTLQHQPKNHFKNPAVFVVS